MNELKIHRIGASISAVLVLVIGVIILVSVISKNSTETHTTQPVINRIDLLTNQGRIMGTYYYYDRGFMYVDGPAIKFKDYKDRTIRYSGNYLVTPIPDTISVDSEQ